MLPCGTYNSNPNAIERAAEIAQKYGVQSKQTYLLLVVQREADT